MSEFNTTPAGYRLNAVADSYDSRDLPYVPTALPVPDTLDPPPWLLVLDQGKEGACTGFGLAAVLNVLDRTRQLQLGAAARGPVSARMLYEMSRKFDEWPGEDYGGASCRAAILGWQNMGVCSEAHWRYEPDAPGRLTLTRAVAARGNMPGAFYRLRPRIADYFVALQQFSAVYCSAQIHRGWFRPDRRSGEILPACEVEGSHAFAIVGYSADGFWVQNSWGKAWGRGGLALWRYEDWQANILDAWVVHDTAPTPTFSTESLGAGDAAKALRYGARRAEIAGHFAHLDEGRFHSRGRYFSDLQDVQITGRFLRGQTRYRHLLLYAHGALRSPTAFANRVAAMKDVFKGNGIYPFHFMYDASLMEALRTLIQERATDPCHIEGFSDQGDRWIERATRRPGRALWRELKRGASSPFHLGRAGSQILSELLHKLPAGTKIHVVGHSAGAVLLGSLLKRLSTAFPELRVATCSLMAPACTVEQFLDQYKPLLSTSRTAFGVDDMAVYNLSDHLERGDSVGAVYGRSLLYLISQSFEDRIGTPILGMEQYSQHLHSSDIAFHYSEGRGGSELETQSESHEGFDNDPATLNAILRRVLGLQDNPALRFSQKQLEY